MREIILISPDEENSYLCRELFKKGRKYPLSGLISKLTSLGIESENLGLVYASLVLSQPKKNRIGRFFGNQESVSEAKIRFQESIRVGLYLLANRLNGGAPLESLLKEYDSHLKDKFSSPGLFTNGIEAEVFRLVNEAKSFVLVCQGLKEGALAYAERLGKYGFGLERKAVEYRDVFEALQKQKS